MKRKDSRAQVCFLFCFLIVSWPWSKAPVCGAHLWTLGPWLLLKEDSEAWCGTGAEPWVQVPFLALLPTVPLHCCQSLGGVQWQESIGSSLPSSEFRVFTLVIWHWPWQKYLNPGNQQMLQIRPPSFCNPLRSQLLAHHRRYLPGQAVSKSRRAPEPRAEALGLTADLGDSKDPYARHCFS